MYGSEISAKVEGITDLFLESHDQAIARAEKHLLHTWDAGGDKVAIELALDGLALATTAAWFKIAEASFMSGIAHGQSSLED